MLIFLNFFVNITREGSRFHISPIIASRNTLPKES